MPRIVPWARRAGAAARPIAAGVVARLRDAWLLASAQLALIAAQRVVWTRPVGGLVEVIPGDADDAAPDAATVPPRPALPPAARRVERAIARAARHGVFRPTCLVRALALCRLLERCGISGARARVGVRRHGSAFGAHAWVDLHGATLGESADVERRFAPLARVRVR